MNQSQRLITYVKTLNFFDDDTTDEHEKTNQIISTRLFIIVYVAILAAFTLYASLSIQSVKVSVSKPNLNQYEDLLAKYSNNIQCSCQNTSILYKQFIDIQLTYHEICSSDFVSERWLEFLYEYNMSYYFQLDFRHSATAFFQSLQTLCQQAQQTINDNLEEFYSTKLIAIELLTNETFVIQTNVLLDVFNRTISKSFPDLVDLFRNMILGNQLFSAQDTNRIIRQPHANLRSGAQLSPIKIAYIELSNQSFVFNCFGENNQIGKLPAGIYYNITRYNYVGSIEYNDGLTYVLNILNTTAIILLPGLFIGCLPLDSLLKSTLECFYNQTCLDIIISYMNHSSKSFYSHSFSVLNQSRFSPSTTFETLMDVLFVEEWKINMSYIHYFQQCQPSFCQYSIEQRKNILYILTMIISLHAGLNSILKIIIPKIVAMIYRKRQQQQQNSHVLIIQADSKSFQLKNDFSMTFFLVSLNYRFVKLWQKVMKSILELNIFDDQSTDEHKKKNQRISTRVYFILLFLLLSIFTLFTSLKTQSKILTINEPTHTQFTSLVNVHPNNLKCPCNQIAIRYDEFISFKPMTHQICSSSWLSLFSNFTLLWNSFIANVNDFRFRALDHFNILKIFCKFTNTTIMNSLTKFYANEYVTLNAIETDLFQRQISSFIEIFQLTTQQLFKQTLDMIRHMLFDNLFASENARSVEFYFLNYTDFGQIFPGITNINGCTCSTSMACKLRSDIQPDSSILFQEFPDIYAACSVVESVLFSTLECFFDEQCILRMKSYMKPGLASYTDLHAMPILNMSSYKMNTSIGVMLEKLFIEDWNTNYSHEKYYSQCKPSYCSYTVQHRPEFVYVLSQVIVIFGGLSIFLRFVVLIIMNNIRKDNRQQQPTVTTSVVVTMRHGIQLAKQKILQLNFFQDRSRNHLVVRQQRLSTRFYLIGLFVSLIVLGLYVSISNITINKSILLNSQNQYEKLQILYPNALHCPCNQISMEYEQFIQINLTYHQICLSDFVKQEWINYLYEFWYVNQMNFRSTATSQFLSLSSLCQLTRQIIETNINSFYTNKYLTSELISFDHFEIQMNSTIDLLKKTMPRTFKRTLDTIRGLIQGNSLLTGYQTSWKLSMIDLYQYAPLYTNPQSYGNSCSCALSAKCTQPAIITYEYPTGLPGLFIGCYPLEALLQSSLECFYDQKCLDLVIQYMNITNKTITMQVLDSYLLSSSDFLMNETIEQMVDRLFIDQWYINQSYDKYFEQCAVTKCTYSYVQKFDILYLVTTLMGLYDGLSKILKIIVPLIIYSILWIVNQKTTRIIPINETENNLQ